MPLNCDMDVQEHHAACWYHGSLHCHAGPEGHVMFSTYTTHNPLMHRYHQAVSLLLPILSLGLYSAWVVLALMERDNQSWARLWLGARNASCIRFLKLESKSSLNNV